MSVEDSLQCVGKHGETLVDCVESRHWMVTYSQLGSKGRTCQENTPPRHCVAGAPCTVATSQRQLMLQCLAANSATTV